MGESLGGLVHSYVTARRRRGEITPSTARNTRSVLAHFVATVGDRPADRLQRRHVLRWMETLGPLAPATRRNRYSAVRGFCRWLVEYRHLRTDPCVGIRAPKVPRSVPRAQPRENVAATLAACPDARARLIVTLMVQQGLRRVEVHRLELGDMDSTAMRVRGKGDHERILPVLPETRAALMRYLADHPASAGPLVRSYTHPSSALSASEIGRIVSRAMAAAGVKHHPRDGVSGHALRHTAATDMLRAGANVRDVQHALGHAHLLATERYLPLLVEPLAEAMGGRSYSL